MSLLLDALKRAEAAKQERDRGEASDGGTAAQTQAGNNSEPDSDADTNHLVEFDLAPDPPAAPHIPPQDTPPDGGKTASGFELELSDEFLALDEPAPDAQPPKSAPTDAPAAGVESTPRLEMPVPPPGPEWTAEPDPEPVAPQLAASLGATRIANAGRPELAPTEPPLAESGDQPDQTAASRTPEQTAAIPTAADEAASAAPSPQQAQRVLAAARARQERARRSRALLLSTVLVLLVATALGAGYLALNRPTVAAYAVPDTSEPVLTAPPAANPPPRPSPVAVVREPQSAPPRTEESAEPLAASQIPADQPTTEPGTTSAPLEPTLQQTLPAAATAPAVATPDSPPLFQRSERPATSGAYAAAYQALREQRLQAAVAQFEQLAARHPNDSEVHKGLALALSRSGDSQGAAQAYLTALAIDPRDPVSQAGLLLNAGNADPAGSLSRLRHLVDAQPQLAILHYALGTLLARSGNWPEAQDAFFSAHRLEPDNAAYAFNLAVSLEHLRQPRVALNYYRRVEALLGDAGTDSQLVDVAAVQARIATLSNTP